LSSLRPVYSTQTYFVSMNLKYYPFTEKNLSILLFTTSFKLSHYRPVGFQEFEASRISRQSAHDRGKVVNPRHRPIYPLGDIPNTNFF
jgi:hypothetical protein